MGISKRVATLAAAWVVAAVAVAEGSTMRSAERPTSTSLEGSILAPAAQPGAPASFLEAAAASAGIGEATAPTALEPNPADIERVDGLRQDVDADLAAPPFEPQARLLPDASPRLHIETQDPGAEAPNIRLPEPTSVMLLTAGLVGLFARRRLRRRLTAPS